jgi:hypothetical protein
MPRKILTFDGQTYDHKRDGPRLTTQYGRTFALMLDGQWRTLAEIASTTGCPEASVSARLRDMRKPRFGEHTVNHRIREGANGLWEYRLILAEEQKTLDFGSAE